jgi:hypothetical protein
MKVEEFEAKLNKLGTTFKKYFKSPKSWLELVVSGG